MIIFKRIFNVDLWFEDWYLLETSLNLEQDFEPI